MNAARQSTVALLALLSMTGAAVAADPSPTVAFLGATARAATAAEADAAGLPDGVGLTVTAVTPHGPTAAAVRPGDVLQKLDDQLLVNVPQMVTLVRLRRPGERVTLTLVRGGKAMAVEVSLGERPRPAANPPPPIGPAVGVDEPIPQLPGVVGPDPVTGTLLPTGTRTAVAYSDATYSARVTTDAAGHKTMVVRATVGGRQVAVGPVDTPEQWAAFPADVRQHLQAVQNLLNGSAHGGSATRP